LEKAKELAKEHISKAQKKQAAMAKTRGQNKEFKVGEEVWVYTPKFTQGIARKFQHYWQGPFRVIGIDPPLNYKVVALKGKPTEQNIHAQRMKPYYNPQDRPVDIPNFVESEDNMDQLDVPERGDHNTSGNHEIVQDRESDREDEIALPAESSLETPPLVEVSVPPQAQQQVDHDLASMPDVVKVLEKRPAWVDGPLEYKCQLKDGSVRDLVDMGEMKKHRGFQRAIQSFNRQLRAQSRSTGN
jgi:hypothetical protein